MGTSTVHMSDSTEGTTSLRGKESWLFRKMRDVRDGTSSDQWPSITQNLSSPPPSSASADKSPSSTLHLTTLRQLHFTTPLPPRAIKLMEFRPAPTHHRPYMREREDQSCERLDGRE
mmetsp:Transcript_20430/g.54736  ORF Transcript_20430/g.54736 Transcript_20430/m.54736 type:complete len:117 (+) Transcript_20430:291-641(+)